MTEFPDEYGEILRRAMRAEADSVVPSPDGLEIIRNRIAQRRGLRGVFWWRAAASAVGAVLVAASIVMIVPGLREQATPPSQGITEIGAETDAPEGQSTRRPPNGRPPEVSSTDTAVPPPPRTVQPSATPSGTATPSATPTATPSATPSKSPTKCPSQGAKNGAASGRPSSCPATATRTPTPTPTPTPTETEEPGCGQPECPASDEPPTETPTEGTAEPEPTLSAGTDQNQVQGQE